MKIPVKVLRAAWIAGTNAREKVEREVASADHAPRRRNPWVARDAGMRAAAEVIIRWAIRVRR